MNRRAPLAAAVLVCAAAAAALGTGRSAYAASVGPVSEAWWNVANNGGGAPAPPGTAAKDLFVGGSKGDQSLPNPTGGGGLPSPFSDVGDKGAASGIAAVSYTVPAGQAVDRLVLHFDGSPQSSISMAACRITGPGTFKAELNGPWSDVPPYDCSVPSIGSLTPDGKAVQFTDIGGLATGSVLSVVIVPEYAAYSDFLPPGPDSLLLRTAPPAYVPPSSGSTSSGSSGSTPSSGASGTGTSLSASPSTPARGGSSYIPPATFSRPPVASTASPPVASTGPAAVSAPPSGIARVPAVRPAAAIPAPDDGRARIASAAGLAAVLGAFAWMLAGDLPRLRRALAARLAGPGTVLPEPQTARGVGRFRRERSGRPPEI